MSKKLPIIPTIFTIFALILLLTLGSWQVKRLLWKNSVIAEISERVAMPPVDLPDGRIDIEKLKYRRIIITGHFLNDKEIHLFTGAKEMRGKPGYNIITPLEIGSGRVIIVDRGWVPASMKERDARKDTIINGDVSIIGMLHAGEHKAMFTPDNDIEKNLWFWIDIPAIASFTGKALDNVYVRALVEDGNERTLPIAGEAMVKVRNDHLSYAVTWYSFAIILLVIYTLYIRGLGVRFRVKKHK